MKLIEKCIRCSVEQTENQIVLPLKEVTLTIGNIALKISGQGICKNDSQKIIVWSGPLDEHQAIKIIDALETAARRDTEPIWLFIDSPGGQIIWAFNIIDKMNAIKDKKIKIITVNAGSANSAAGLVAVSGSKGFRYMNKDSSMLVHKPSVPIEVLVKDIERYPVFNLGGEIDLIFTIFKKHLVYFTAELVRCLITNSRMSVASIISLLESNNGKGTRVKIQEALQYGFCDHEIYGIDISNENHFEI